MNNNFFNKYNKYKKKYYNLKGSASQTGETTDIPLNIEFDITIEGQTLSIILDIADPLSYFKLMESIQDALKSLKKQPHANLLEQYKTFFIFDVNIVNSNDESNSTDTLNLALFKDIDTTMSILDHSLLLKRICNVFKNYYKFLNFDNANSETFSSNYKLYFKDIDPEGPMPTIQINIKTPFHLNCFYDTFTSVQIEFISIEAYEEYLKNYILKYKEPCDKYIKTQTEKRIQRNSDNPPLNAEVLQFMQEIDKQKFIDINLFNYEYNLFKILMSQPGNLDSQFKKFTEYFEMHYRKFRINFLINFFRIFNDLFNLKNFRKEHISTIIYSLSSIHNNDLQNTITNLRKLLLKR